MTPTSERWLRHLYRRGRELQHQQETIAEAVTSERGSDSPSASNVDRESEDTLRVDISSMVDSEREEKWDKVKVRLLSPTRKRIGNEEVSIQMTTVIAVYVS